MTLAAEKDAVIPTGLIIVERLTLPPNPPWPLIVIVDVPEEPASTVRVVGFAEMAKSPTPTVTITEWINEPLVPVIVTL